MCGRVLLPGSSPPHRACEDREPLLPRGLRPSKRIWSPRQMPRGASPRGSARRTTPRSPPSRAFAKAPRDPWPGTTPRRPGGPPRDPPSSPPGTPISRARTTLRTFPTPVASATVRPPNAMRQAHSTAKGARVWCAQWHSPLAPPRSYRSIGIIWWSSSRCGQPGCEQGRGDAAGVPVPRRSARPHEGGRHHGVRPLRQLQDRTPRAARS